MSEDAADHDSGGEAAPAAELVGYERTLAQVWDNYFAPELEARRTAGAIGDDFFVYMAQVLFPVAGSPRVLFNEEVSGDGLLRANREVAKDEALTLADLALIERYELPDELLDNGHFTIMRADAGWRMFFNFRSGRAKAKDMLLLAAQFLEAARTSRQKGHAGPTVYNLFTAAELISKAELVLIRSEAVSARNHRAVASAINIWGHSGNIDAAFVALFNRLGQQRPNAVYADSEHRPPMPAPESIELVDAMIARGLQAVARATDRASA